MRQKIFVWWLLCGLWLMGCGSPATNPTTVSAAAEPLLVAAAASLQFALTDIANLYQQETGQKVTLTFGSTGQLAQQIENGAPYDLFAAADVITIERLKTKDLIIPETQQIYAQGRLVLVVNKSAGRQVTDLKQLTDPAIKRIAIANPELAPYGVAAKQALETMSIWERVKSKIVYGENIRQALQYVQTGDAPVGIVALSEVNVPGVSWMAIDDKWYQPLNQSLAVIKRSPRAVAAKAFAAFINGSQGQALLKKYGFGLPNE
jgi:molybdate transport system substrate-binding protein